MKSRSRKELLLRYAEWCKRRTRHWKARSYDFFEAGRARAEADLYPDDRKEVEENLKEWNRVWDEMCLSSATQASSSELLHCDRIKALEVKKT